VANQRTIRQEVEFTGVGLFSGKPVQVRLKPAVAETGILFIRADLPDAPVVPATVDAYAEVFRRSALRWNDVTIETPEHFLAACYSMGIDNLIVEINAEEMPVLDGSSSEFCAILQSAGVADLGASRPVFEVKEPITISADDASITALPYPAGLQINYLMDFGGRYLPTQTFTCDFQPDSFVREIAPCRTFALSSYYDEFKRLGVGGGVTDDNAVVINTDGSFTRPISREPAQLRFPDECVRHKVLDFIGDMALTGLEVRGRFMAVKSGHQVNARMARRIREAFNRPEETGKAADKHLGIREIWRALPHRFPFLMVDRILELVEDKRAVGIKNVSINEPFFTGHYPEMPIMPGVLQVEAMAQVAGVLLLRRLENVGKVAMLVSIDGVKLRRPVVPGDQLRIEVEVTRLKSRAAQVQARTTVDGQATGQAVLRFMLVDAEMLE